MDEFIKYTSLTDVNLIIEPYIKGLKHVKLLVLKLIF
jgi:hypothetical protein